MNPSNRKPLKLVITLALLVILIGGGAFLGYYFVNKTENSNEKLIAALSSGDVANLDRLEKMYLDAFYGRISVKDLFDEQTYNGFVTDTDAAVNLWKSVDKFNAGFVDGKVQDSFRDIQSKLDKRAPDYQKTAELVQVFRNAYAESDSSLLEPYLNEDSPALTAAERFNSYFKEKRSLDQLLDTNNCRPGSAVPVCQQLRKDYNDNEDSIANSSAAVRALFAAYDDTIYTSSELLADKIWYVLAELKGENEE